MNNRNALTKIAPTIAVAILLASCKAPVYQNVSGLEEPKQTTKTVNTGSSIRRSDPFFDVSGEVKRPGPAAYLGETTLIVAVDAAGGFTELADPERLLLHRRDGSVKHYSYTQVLDGKSENPRVFPGDMLEVKKKKFAWWPW
jgi:hypothetical protein